MDRITAAKVFITINEQSSMTNAAKVLGMSRSMVTRYLGEMENWSKTLLLHRSTRRLSLTPAGENTLTQCYKLLETADSITLSSQNLDGLPSGLIRISCAQFVTLGILDPFISNFLRRYPLVSIDLNVSNKTVDLVRERIDLAIRITNSLDPNIIARRLGTLTSVLCASDSYLKQYGTPQKIHQLSQHNCLTYSYFGNNIWHFNHEDEVVSVAVSGNLSANEPSALLHAAIHGTGISLLPKKNAASYIKEGKLRVILPNYSPESLGIYSIFRSRKHMPIAMRFFIDSLIKHLASIQT